MTDTRISTTSSPASAIVGGSVAHLEETNRRLRSLVQFAREIKAHLELRHLLPLIPRLVTEETSCTGAAVMLWDADTGLLGPAEAYGDLPADFAERWLAAVRAGGMPHGSELALAMQMREPTAYGDVLQDSRLIAVREVLGASDIGGAVAIPLIAHDELLGVLVTYDCTREAASEDKVAYLAAMGEEAATAVQNARLYAQNRREIRRRDTLRSVVASISSELDLESLFERVAASAVELLDATCGSISIVDDTGAAHIRAVHRMPSSLVGVRLEPGDGIIGQALAARSTVFVADYSRDVPRTVPTVHDVHAAIAEPIWWNDALVGVFAVFDADPSRVLDDQDRDAVQMLAGHVAIAMENARLYGQAQTRLAEIVGLQQLGTALLEEHDFDRVLQVICAQLLHLTGAEGVGLALLEEGGRYLEMRTVVGPSAERLLGARIPLEGSFAGEALRTNQPQRSDNAVDDPRGYQPSLVLGHTRTILSVPMKTRQRVVGTISIYNKIGGGGFTERDSELATLFANQAAVAVENARLYEQTREYAVVEERNRLARELHDSVTQSLFSVTLLVQATLNLWERDPTKARERLERASELAQGAIAEMRALIFELRPMALQEEGLLSALKKHVAALKNRESFNICFDVEGDERRLPAPVEEAVFRITQESLNNVVKHAEASEVQALLRLQPDSLEMSIRDNGRGFDVAAGARGHTMGMTSMRERAEAVRGDLSIDSAPGRGTRVQLRVPLPLGGNSWGSSIRGNETGEP